MATEPVLLGKYASEVDADLAIARLEGSGIEAFVIRDDSGGMLPNMSYTLGIRIYVRAEDAERAREILADPGDEEETGDGEE